MGIGRGVSAAYVTRLVWDGNLTVPAGSTLNTATSSGNEFGANVKTYLNSLTLGTVFAAAGDGLG